MWHVSPFHWRTPIVDIIYRTQISVKEQYPKDGLLPWEVYNQIFNTEEATEEEKENGDKGK